MRRMFDCPYKPFASPCDFELDCLILEQAERESLAAFEEMQKELHYYYERVQLLEALLNSYGLPIPPYED